MTHTETVVPELQPGELIETPSGLKTRLVLVPDENSEYEEKGVISSYEGIAALSWGMTYGEIRAMKLWCMGQGGAVPWQLKKLFGVISLPWAATLSLFILMIAAAQGLPLDWAVILFFLFITLTIGAGFWLAEYKFNEDGKCLIGGNCGVAKEYRKGIEVYGWKGKKRKISNSGYCTEHAFTKDRAKNWTIVTQQVWRGIISNPIRKRNPLRVIGYAFGYLLGYREEFLDPRPIGQGYIYRRADKRKPRDQINENLILSAQQHLVYAATALDKLAMSGRKL